MVPSRLKDSWWDTETCRSLLIGPFPFGFRVLPGVGPTTALGSWRGVLHRNPFLLGLFSGWTGCAFQKDSKGNIKTEKMAIWLLLNLSIVRPVLFLGINPQLAASLDNVCWPSWLQPFFFITEDNSPRWVLAQSSISFSHSPSLTFLSFYVFSSDFSLPPLH